MTSLALIVVLVGAVGLVGRDRHRAVRAPTGSDVGVVSSAPSASPVPTDEPTLGGGLLPTHSTVLGAQRASGATPVSVSIPRLRVQTATTAAGLASDGRSLALLPSARSVVWWAYGASPGAASGTVLLAGHVSWNGRIGVLAGLRSLRVGDRIAVRRQDGTTVSYDVTGRRRVPKMSLDQLGLFATTGAPRLVLVTCGGAFDPARHSYEDNVVVQARPA